MKGLRHREKQKEETKMTDQRNSEKMVRLKGELHKMHKTHVETIQEAEKRMHAELLEESSKMRAYKDQLEELVKATGNGNPEWGRQCC